MTSVKTQIGIISYWTLADTNLEKLRSGLAPLGLDKFAPDERTPLSALRMALQSSYPEKLIRQLQRPGFAVVNEKRGDKANDYTPVAAAWFEADGTISVFEPDADQARRVREAYHSERDMLRARQVGGMMARIAVETLHGTMLRPTGGVYWIAESHADEWKAVADAVEAAQSRNSVYVLRHEMDSEAIRAVRDAIVAEVNGQVARIRDEIFSGDLGERALVSRESEAKQLAAKVREYESMLAVGLSDLRASLEEVETAAAGAAVLAAAGTDSGEPLLTDNNNDDAKGNNHVN